MFAYEHQINAMLTSPKSLGIYYQTTQKREACPLGDTRIWDECFMGQQIDFSCSSNNVFHLQIICYPFHSRQASDVLYRQ